MTNSEAAKATLDPKEINAGTKPVKEYKFPPINLLQKGAAPRNRANINAGLQAKARMLEETLHNFNISAKVTNVTQGPAVTRYEIEPDIGVKVKSIVSLADDIALNLEAKSIRLEAPIPGKKAIGIEVENDNINMVTLSEIIGSEEFKQAKSKITFCGRDVS
jgi:S-DNA-T family DNA segregation ATPase FtsK/SpoIIIE